MADVADRFLFGVTMVSERPIPESSLDYMSEQILCGKHMCRETSEGRQKSNISSSDSSAAADADDTYLAYDLAFNVVDTWRGLDLLAKESLQGKHLSSLFHCAAERDEFIDFHHHFLNVAYSGRQLPGKSALWGPSLLKLKGRVDKRHRYYQVTWQVTLGEPYCLARLNNIRRYRFSGRGTSRDTKMGDKTTAAHLEWGQTDLPLPTSTSSSENRQRPSAVIPLVIGRSSL
eukprot:TRINITY_DN16256_c0_g1_i2.p1 TRINITY_DN16256_c0_g1~~TRINITY_DN16256_c0_g1_i2.p1  ORF type:complete len:231 (+),score=16.13 TRINITY_DN16256_c0_g1_i2:2-694(+)